MTDGALLAEALRRHHPDPFRAVSREDFDRTAQEAETMVDLMRLLTLLGDRNGHTKIVPFDAHRSPLRAYPMRLYEFADGVFVVAAQDESLAGSELVTVAGEPIDELNRALAPLVAHDNEWTVRARRPKFAVTTEVLSGLGVLARLGPATFGLRRPDGTRREVALEPMITPEWEALLGTDDALPTRRTEPHRVEPLAGGRAVLIGYDVTRGDTRPLAARIDALAQGVGLVVLDLRRNAGGNSQTYGPLLDILERLSTNESKRLAVLTSRVTFSAAMQLVVDLEQRTSAVFAGEPTGASPNHFGDATEIELPRSGLLARVATISWTTAGAHEERVTREPDVPVPLESTAYFAGRDVVLEAALA